MLVNVLESYINSNDTIVLIYLILKNLHLTSTLLLCLEIMSRNYI